MTKQLKIGLFGFGCVGQGLFHVLNSSKGFRADIVKIAVKNRHKKRNVPGELITYEKNDILNNPEIDVVVELIDDAEEAFRIVSEALKRGKHVVTANKALLALHGEEILAAARSQGVVLPDDVRNYPGFSGRFMLKLLQAWAAMGFRRPKVQGVAD